MAQSSLVFASVALAGVSALAQTTGSDFTLALPDHQGQLRWSADGFKIVQYSAKPNGHEIGIRGREGSGRITLLGFLFLFPEQAPLTSVKCRDEVLGPEKKGNPTLKISGTSESVRPGNLPIALASYTAKGDGPIGYMVRAFTATGDICGDLEFYSSKPISSDDADLKKILASYRLDQSYTPRVADVVLYAKLLYDEQKYKAAAPIFEAALSKINDNDAGPFRNARTTRRVVTDQAGMSYGMSGDIPKARTIFEKAIAEDPDYPLYYYNLACADAEEKKLADARRHLQQAFARKANVISGESMPDPTKDDSFLPYRNNKEFWTFLESLQVNR